MVVLWSATSSEPAKQKQLEPVLLGLGWVDRPYPEPILELGNAAKPEVALKKPPVPSEKPRNETLRLGVRHLHWEDKLRAEATTPSFATLRPSEEAAASCVRPPRLPPRAPPFLPSRTGSRGTYTATYTATSEVHCPPERAIGNEERQGGTRMTTTPPSRQQSLEQALEAFVEDLEGLEGSLLKFEEALLELEEGALKEGALKEGALKEGALKEGALKEGAPEHQNGQNTRLLSPSEICQELGEERTVVYRRLRSGEIPCLKLGHALKVRHADLQEYMKGQRRDHLRSLGEENSFKER